MSTLGVLRGICTRRNALQPFRSIDCKGQLGRHYQGPLGRHVLNSPARVLTTSRSWKKEDAPVKPHAVSGAAVPSNPATAIGKSPIPSAKQPLLAEQTVTNKEQRQADWAIIKDMAHYLWPKNDLGTRFRVGLSLALLVGAKVAIP